MADYLRKPHKTGVLVLRNFVRFAKTIWRTIDWAITLIYQLRLSLKERV